MRTPWPKYGDTWKCSLVHVRPREQKVGVWSARGLRALRTREKGARQGQQVVRDRRAPRVLADAGVVDSVRIVLGGHKAKTVTDRHYTARNLPRFVPAIEALRFETIAGLADMMPDEDARAA